MNTLTFLKKLCCLSLIVFLASCGKDNSSDPKETPNNYFRLNAFEVDVIPKDRLVKILFQASDYEGKGVGSITKDDLMVFENGGLIDLEGDLKITRDSTPYNLKTVMLLDLTRSVEGMVGQIKSACIAMINKKLPTQEIAIYTFDASTKLVLDFTSSPSELIAAINSIPETDLVNSTNLYGAIIEVSDLWTDSYSLESITDGSLIIFTDGRHNATPAITLNDAVRSLEGKKRYVAALTGADLDETSLKILADEDERYFIAEDITSLERMFLDIQADIQRLSNSIYYMDYQSPITDPTPFDNELQVEVKNNANRGEDRLIKEEFSSEGFGL